MRVLHSREFLSPCALLLEVTYTCKSGHEGRQGEVHEEWTIQWPVVEGLIMETVPTCARCGSLLTIVSRKMIDRSPVRDREIVRG